MSDVTVAASTIQAVVMTAVGRLENTRIADPVPEPHQLVVEIRSVGICGSDVAYLHHGRIGAWTVTTPFVLGHETAGVVVQVGSAADPALLHRRVAVEPSTPCYRCSQCRQGRYHLCPDLAFLATPPHDGCLAERIAIDENCVFPIPDSMTFDQAALVEPASVGLWACRRAQLQPGDRVHVTGAGPVGVLAGLMAKTLGAGRVTITDIDTSRRVVARESGLEVCDEVAVVDVLLECSGNESALHAALDTMAPGGRVALVGISHQEYVGVPFPALFSRELTFVTVSRYAHTWPAVIDYIASGRLNVDRLVTHHFPLSETADAFATQARDPSAVKIMIHPTAAH